MTTRKIHYIDKDGKKRVLTLTKAQFLRRLRAALKKDPYAEGVGPCRLEWVGSYLLAAHLARGNDLSSIVEPYAVRADYFRSKNRFAHWYGDASQMLDLASAEFEALPLRTPIQMNGSRHSVVATTNNIIKIGCEVRSTKAWLKNYTQIGERHGYSSSQIEDYGEIIRKVAEMQKTRAVKA